MNDIDQADEIARLKAQIAELTDRVIAAESSNVDAADLARENADLRRQCADAPTTEAAVAQLREWVPAYEVGATHVAMPVAMARKLLTAIDEASSHQGGRLGRLAAVLLDLDRCVHGRHQGDACADCGGRSRGNHNMPTWTVVGYDLYGRPLVAPDREHWNDADAWRGKTTPVDAEAEQ